MKSKFYFYANVALFVIVILMILSTMQSHDQQVMCEIKDHNAAVHELPCTVISPKVALVDFS